MAMAFFTLLERKYLGYFQARVGPTKVSFYAILQPILDALKLLVKETILPFKSNALFFSFTPLFMGIVALLLWTIAPHHSSTFASLYSYPIILCITSFGFFFLLLSGWSSNSKYSLIGTMRGVAQSISYEVSLVTTFLALLVILQTLTFSDNLKTRAKRIFILSLSLRLIWYATILAETHRTPFDLREGESELVRGYNTEYSSALFILIYASEYIHILFFALLSIRLLLNPPYSLGLLMAPTLTCTLYASSIIWLRASLPRIRFDLLMSITWISFLPISLLGLWLNRALKFL